MITRFENQSVDKAGIILEKVFQSDIWLPRIYLLSTLIHQFQQNMRKSELSTKLITINF